MYFGIELDWVWFVIGLLCVCCVGGVCGFGCGWDVVVGWMVWWMVVWCCVGWWFWFDLLWCDDWMCVWFGVGMGGRLVWLCGLCLGVGVWLVVVDVCVIVVVGVVVVMYVDWWFCWVGGWYCGCWIGVWLCNRKDYLKKGW